jgi:outer membrane protein OmpA-like peptidoglycan-associated protein
LTNLSKMTALAAAGCLGFGAHAVAQNPQLPHIKIETTSVSLVVGGQSGKGVLTLPNLGKRCAYPIKVSSFGVGIKVGVSKVTAVGVVRNMRRLSDLPGRYNVFQGETTVIVGGSHVTLQNRNNAVRMDLKSSAEGLNLGAAFEGMTIEFVRPPWNTPRPRSRRYIVYFGYNKIWGNAETKATVRRIAQRWKCRYTTFEVIGHTDTTGKEGYNVTLSDKRAKTVRDLLVKTGINPQRIATRAAGENEPLRPTRKGVRLRANRAAVIRVQF